MCPSGKLRKTSGLGSAKFEKKNSIKHPASIFAQEARPRARHSLTGDKDMSKLGIWIRHGSKASRKSENGFTVLQRRSLAFLTSRKKVK